MKKIVQILERKEYTKSSLDETTVDKNPVKQFESWFKDAEAAKIVEANAMAVATVGKNNAPSIRISLLKEYTDQGFIFFTNYESRKGQELSQNAQVALTFFWQVLERQVRIEGISQKLDPQESDRYFALRPRGSQIGAWASPQSTRVKNRQELEERYHLFEKKYGNLGVPRPPHWGGYLVVPTRIEFWQGRENRFHDRILYEKEISGSWSISRLAP